MANSIETLMNLINVDELDFAKLQNVISEEDIPNMVDLTFNEDPAIAVNAITTLGLFPSAAAMQRLRNLFDGENSLYKTAAAHALRNFRNIPGSNEALEVALADNDVNVRKFALESISKGNFTALKERLNLFQANETNQHLKKISARIQGQLL